MASLRPLLAWSCFCAAALAAETGVDIRADFPGGNVLVLQNQGNTVHLAPDLRGGEPWFYWNFEARCAAPGRVTFILPHPPIIGVRGPAVSHDDGKTWEWLGAEHVTYARGGQESRPTTESFYYDFTRAGESVRLAVAIPYVQSNLDAFLKQHASNPDLARSVLVKSKGGRDVELLQVGKAGAGIQPMLLTARSHACESMASYVLEGFLKEAISESWAGAEFRRRYVLYCVPFIDKDGVEAGDQGKGRRPHDHNRDYGTNHHLYPEVAAIEALAAEKKVTLALDLHCPALRGDIHEAFYFDGWSLPNVRDNVRELVAWIGEERPPVAGAPIDLLKAPPATRPTTGLPFSQYFAQKTGMIMAATLEVPYTQPQCNLDAQMARDYGAALCRAWVRTHFLLAPAIEPRNSPADFAHLAQFRATFQKVYRQDPAQAEQLIADYQKLSSPAPYRAEANILMARLRASQKRTADAVAFCDAAFADPAATMGQRAAAILQRLHVLAGDPATAPRSMEDTLARLEQLLYPSAEQQADAFETAGDYYRQRQDYSHALDYARRQVPVASRYDKGRALNRLALLHELLGQQQQAIDARRQAVQVLRQQLDPVPPGIFGARMAADLFDALQGIPTATLAEKRAAANMVLNHPVAPQSLRDRVNKALEELR